MVAEQLCYQLSFQDLDLRTWESTGEFVGHCHHHHHHLVYAPHYHHHLVYLSHLVAVVADSVAVDPSGHVQNLLAENQVTNPAILLRAELVDVAGFVESIVVVVIAVAYLLGYLSRHQYE